MSLKKQEASFLYVNNWTTNNNNNNNNNNLKNYGADVDTYWLEAKSMKLANFIR